VTVFRACTSRASAASPASDGQRRRAVSSRLSASQYAPASAYAAIASCQRAASSGAARRAASAVRRVGRGRRGELRLRLRELALPLEREAEAELRARVARGVGEERAVLADGVVEPAHPGEHVGVRLAERAIAGGGCEQPAVLLLRAGEVVGLGEELGERQPGVAVVGVRRDPRALDGDRVGGAVGGAARRDRLVARGRRRRRRGAVAGGVRGARDGDQEQATGAQRDDVSVTRARRPHVPAPRLP
jgi:hypothetical protein